MESNFKSRFVRDTIPELYHHVFIVGAVVTKLDIPEEARKELEVDEAVSSALEPENRRSALQRRSARS
jgi:hypothetical protein